MSWILPTTCGDEGPSGKANDLSKRLAIEIETDRDHRYRPVYPSK